MVLRLLRSSSPKLHYVLRALRCNYFRITSLGDESLSTECACSLSKGGFNHGGLRRVVGKYLNNYHDQHGIELGT